MSTRDLPARIGDLPAIGRPANGALLEAGITTLDEVARMSEKELLALHGVGPRAVRLLREALDERGLAFRS
ncbi:helix-hairpin-helix domain-containing protein [Georgenia sp. H159]|uniref:helix-hairpin-helix domain-containing protein n=1 Tax=Georgenia sp. H159 TaxID=3076115 RepID=UPI002D76D1F5|nr:helix-hairpin-helix domain-containing protein [Georgenia sp. H159]